MIYLQTIQGPRTKENVCLICEDAGDLIQCEGPCEGAFHHMCLGMSRKPNSASWRCEACKSGEKLCNHTVREETGLTCFLNVSSCCIYLRSMRVFFCFNHFTPTLTFAHIDIYSSINGEAFCCFTISGKHTCFVCKSSEGEVKQCRVSHCGKFYHLACISAYPHARIENNSISCPLHVCGTCYTENPKNPKCSKGKNISRLTVSSYVQHYPVIANFKTLHLEVQCTHMHKSSTSATSEWQAQS